MNNENNNGYGKIPPVPNMEQNNQGGLNDVINNNAGVNIPVNPPVNPQANPQANQNIGVSPINPMPQMNPADQVITPSNSYFGESVPNSPETLINNEPVNTQPIYDNGVNANQNGYSASTNNANMNNYNQVNSPVGQNGVNSQINPMPQNNQVVNNQMPLGEPMPSFENPGSIGTNPPINNEKAKPTKKKGLNKTLFVILLIVVMAAIGGGVYWYLNLSKSNEISVKLKDVIYDINEQPSTDLATYATISGTNGSNCVLDTSKIDTTKKGEYNYTITCGSEIYKGKAIVADNSAPIVSVVSVHKPLNSTVKPEEFIGTCFDSTKCNYSFEDETAVTAAMAKVGGPTIIKINITDENGNKTTAEGNLNVISSEVRALYDCTSKEQNVEGFNAKMVLTHSLAILKDNAPDGSLAFGNFGTQTIKYKFTDQKQFETLYESFKKNLEIKINDITGIGTFDEKEMTITLIRDLDLTGLKTQYGDDKFVSFKTIAEFYKTTLGYTCSQKTA